MSAFSTLPATPTLSLRDDTFDAANLPAYHLYALASPGRLRLAVLERPKAAQAMWDAIHRRIGISLTRIDTLRALSQWEESNTTPAAQQYQRSIEEEAHLVIQDLRDEVKTALRQVATT